MKLPDSRIHFAVQDIGPACWKHILYTLLVPVDGLTLASLREVPMHPMEELIRLEKQEIQESTPEEAIYLLARIIKYADSTGRDDMSFSELAKPLHGAIHLQSPRVDKPIKNLVQTVTR